MVERVARALCEVRGQDPDEDAPLGVICGPNNEPLPHWRAFEEEARAAIEAMSPDMTMHGGGGDFDLYDKSEGSCLEKLKMLGGTIHSYRLHEDGSETMESREL